MIEKVRIKADQDIPKGTEVLIPKGVEWKSTHPTVCASLAVIEPWEKDIFDSESIIRDDCRVDWCELGEGLNGDYDPDDPDDIELLRFDVYKRIDREWEPVNDASYCTQVPVSATKEQRKWLLTYIMDEYWHGGLMSYPDNSVKKLGEKLSWISLETIET